MENESQTPDSNRSPVDRKPWPMWPIALSILSFIVFYTWLQFKFRKTEKPYEPSRAMQERVERAAEKNLYDWYSLAVNPIAQTTISNAPSIIPNNLESPLEEVLPSQIVYYIPRKPILIPRAVRVLSDPTFDPAQALSIALEMPEAFAKSPFFHLTALYKEDSLVLLAEMRVENETELARFNSNSPNKTLYFSIDTQPIENEAVTVKLYTREKSYHWEIKQRRTRHPSDSDNQNSGAQQ